MDIYSFFSSNQKRTVGFYCLMVFLGFLGTVLPGFADDESHWVGVSGIFDYEEAAVYGEQGVSNTRNLPGKRDGAIGLTDSSGLMWYFGGYGDVGYLKSGLLNDLWCYNPTTGEWTWIKGSSEIDQPGIYGKQGIPDENNTPGGREDFVGWIDQFDHIWIFGGIGFDADGERHLLNDLWKYDPLTNHWTWMKGASVVDQPSVYGEKGVSDSENTPGARYNAVSWMDKSGNLWLFGGGNFGGIYNDLWKYDPKTGNWTWMKGSSEKEQAGVYGKWGSHKDGTTPGARKESVGWIDHSGNFWLFGGWGCDTTGQIGKLNDLWMFDPAVNKWAFMKGSVVAYGKARYGSKGVEDKENTPGHRAQCVGWTGKDGCLWLFGGENNRTYNDFWRYNPATGNWTWMKGGRRVDQPGVYGVRGKGDVNNSPRSGCNGVGWTDLQGNLWFRGESTCLCIYDVKTDEWIWVEGNTIKFGEATYGHSQQSSFAEFSPKITYGASGWSNGSGGMIYFGGNSRNSSRSFMGDLWEFDPVANKWTLLSGDLKDGKNGVYGQKGHGSVGNFPGARSGAVGWTDNKGNHWVFGGYVQYTMNRLYFNDLWRYNPSLKEWTWMKGSDTLCHQRSWYPINIPFGGLDKKDKNPNPKGIYRTKGLSDHSSTPGSRVGSVTWTDKDGSLWLFGGEGFDAQGEQGQLNDLWKFDHRANQWIWMSGSSEVGQLGIYGTKGVVNQKSVPGARSSSISWTDQSGNLWLFGGYSRQLNGRFNDLWRYNPRIYCWTWISGNMVTDQFGLYGEKGSFSPENMPGARSAGTGWVDQQGGDLYLFGGGGMAESKSGALNDLWKYNLKKGEWSWLEGSSDVDQFGELVAPGVPDPLNCPGSRSGPYGWSDDSGNFWLLGGYGYDCGGEHSRLSDLWMYGKFKPAECLKIPNAR